MAKQKESENLSFFYFVKREIPSAKFDQLIHDWGLLYFNKIDCTSCGNCCKNYNPSFLGDDLKKYERILTSEEILELLKNLYFDELGNRHLTTCTPCPFLKSNNHCKIYPDRPMSCQQFPNLFSKNQKYRLRKILTDYEICPIIFNTIEKLKDVINFK